MTGVRMVKIGRRSTAPETMLPTTVLRPCTARSTVVWSSEGGIGLPSGTSRLSTCSPEGRVTTRLTHPCADAMRSAYGRKRSRSGPSSNGIMESASSVAADPRSSASTAVMSARTRSIAPRSNAWRSRLASTNPPATANSAIGTSVASDTTRRCERSFTPLSSEKGPEYAMRPACVRRRVPRLRS